MAEKKEPRGIRNRNPLNIRYSAANDWLGKLTHSKQDMQFEEFIDTLYGFRAGMCLIMKYIKTYGFDTIEKIVRRWAPPSENNTENYIKTVCKMTGMERDRKLWPECACQIIALARAMAFVEVGKKYDYYYLLTAYRMAAPNKSECEPLLKEMMVFLDFEHKELHPCTY